MKVLIEIYSTYGKGENETLEESYVIEDTKENREKILEEIYYDYIYGKEEFINGKENSCSYDKCDDWDSPTGGNIYIKTYEEKVKEIDDEFKNKLLELGRLFV